MCFILCPLEPICSCSVLRKTSCKTALHWVKIFSSLLHHGSLKLFSEVLPSNPFTRQTWGKMRKTNLSSLHAFDLLPGPFSRPQFTPRRKPVTAASSQKRREQQEKSFLIYFFYRSCNHGSGMTYLFILLQIHGQRWEVQTSTVEVQ